MRTFQQYLFLCFSGLGLLGPGCMVTTPIEQIPDAGVAANEGGVGANEGGGGTDASSGSCTLQGSVYDQSCSVDADCIAVFFGNVCEDVCIGDCANAAINVSASARYKADFNATPARSTHPNGGTCSCALGPLACCRGAMCDPHCSPPNDAGAGSDADSGSPTDGSNSCIGCPCAAGSDCSPNEICGFPASDACAAKGQCFAAPQVVCQAYSPGCACDGSQINTTCTGLPGGYETKPLRHTGICVDGG